MTSSRRAVRRGKQEPRVLLRPRFDSEDDARDAVDLIASCGQELDPFQVTLTLITLASIGGELSASEVGALIARQNGKGGWLEAIAIWSLFETYLYGEERLPGRKNTTLWTAHELKTSDEAWARVKSLIEANPDLKAEVVTWNGGLTGTHIIELRDGSRLIFLARSKSSGRGFSPRRIIFDEAQELSALAFRAMMYATSAQGARRQLIFAGTVPSDENDSAIFTGVRDRGRSGKVARLAWAEWTPEGSDNPRTPPDPEDWAVRAAANPALGTRILASTIDDEWEAAQADLEGFMRERLSVWPSSDALAADVLPGWPDCFLDAEPPPLSAIGIAVSLNAKWASIASADLWPDGDRVNLSAVDRRRGTAWIVTEAKRIKDQYGCSVAIDEKCPDATLIPALREAGVNPTVMSLDDYIEAWSDLVNRARDKTVTHQATTELDLAISVAGLRSVGDGRRVPGRVKSKGDIDMLEAAVCAMREALLNSYDPLESIG
ncbi:hypothetical protein [Nocardioides sp. J54]|uniref:hypothetical protein n=1 Tax=Nocardioides sp. J54 TaxID=935866 RepID=UPI00048E2942|nr:hypothetical protein [Nocardioides sp. J54]